MPGRIRPAIAPLLATALLVCVAPPAPAVSDTTAGAASPAGSLVGLDLASALARLQESGLLVVYTSELVHPEMRVESEPSDASPVVALQQLLAPHGLRAVASAGGVWVVVRAAPPPASADQPRPETSRARSNPHPTPSPPVLREEIVVRADGEPGERSAGHALALLDQHALASVPAFGNDPVRTVSLLPGVTGDDLSVRLSIHGGRPDQVGVLLDGQELYDPYHLKDYHDGLSLVPGLSLGHAALHAGGMPASYGDRLSGVLDLQSASPSSGHQVAQASSFDASLAAAGTSTAAAVSWLVTGRRGSPPLPTEPVGDRDPSYWDVFAKLDAEPGASAGSLRAHGLVSGEALDLRPQDHDDSLIALRSRYASRYWWLSHQRGVGDRMLVETRLSVAQMARDRGGAAAAQEGGSSLRDRRSFRALAGEQTWSLQASAAQLWSGGWQARRYDGSFDYALGRPQPGFTVLTPLPGGAVGDRRFTGALAARHLASWTSDTTSFGGATFVAGLRYDRDDETGAPLWSPRLEGVLSLGERGVVRGSWGRYSQSQRPYELQVEDGETRLSPAERSSQWDLQYQGELRRGVSLGIGLFRQRVGAPRVRYENLLDPLGVFPEARPDRVQVAATAGRAEALQLSLRGRGRRLDWWVAYNLARAEDRLDGRWVPRAFDQRHSVLADLDLHPTAPWDLNFAWRYHSGWPITPVAAIEGSAGGAPGAAGPPVLILGPLASDRDPAYHRLDVRLSRRWNVAASELTLFAEVQNAYRRGNAAGLDVELDPATGDIVLRQQHWPSLVPIVGAIWRH